MNAVTDFDLMSAACAAREMSYSPYSGFSVGAALLCADGTIYTGCNIENAAYTPTVCAERTAFFKAVSDGRLRFTAIAVTGGRHGKTSPFCPPCGVCRQVMTEFCLPDFRILLGTRETIRVFSLVEILPFSFTNQNTTP